MAPASCCPTRLALAKHSSLLSQTLSGIFPAVQKGLAIVLLALEASSSALA